ncbi:MAG TPA: hypothetical protein VGF69_01230 [Thermoanaerobaculia bacterium]|jgi:hypothetical protein
MRTFPFVFALVTALALGCGGNADGPDHQAEWRNVLQHKKAALAPDATTKQKQVYADSVAAFVQRYPDHGRAREVFRRMQVEFADELASVGRYQDSIRFYRAVLEHDPHNQDAMRGLRDAVERLAVSREKLVQLEKGMSHREVAAILGKPMPGWTAKNKRRGATIEAWYYRTRTGGVAGVYFRDGKVFAAEENSHAKMSRLGS